MRRGFVLGVAGLCTLALAVSCGGSSNSDLFSSTGGHAGVGGTSGSGGAVGGAGGSMGGTAGATGGNAGTGGNSGGTAGTGGSTGGTAGTGATGGGGNDGGPSGGAPNDGGPLDGATDAPVCKPNVLGVDHVIAEIYTAYDDSGSMWDPVSGGGTKWSETSAAFQQFVGDPLSKNLWVELSFMPPTNQILDDCQASSYSPPDVPFGQLGSGTAQQIDNALAPITTGGASPWYAAMQVAIQAATTEATAKPERDVAILFLADWVGATDCNPSGTPFGQEAAPTAQLAAQALAGTPSIHTWVLGLSTVASDQSYFDPIAVAGGTKQALFPNPPLQANVVTALDVMHHAVDCHFRLPQVNNAPPVLGTFDLRLQSNGMHTLTQVSDESACVPDGWWSTGPRRVHFCQQDCDTFLGDPNAKVDLVTKCK